jgi:hypothetical protein
MTLFWSHTGPLVRYEGGVLHIHDLNPEVKTQWRMSRFTMFKFGLRALWAACRR